jgi:glucosyl-3-phosphoglycerate synthase
MSLDRARAWYERNTFAHSEFSADVRASVSVCLPARDEAATIAPIVSELMRLLGAGVVSQVVVVDDSTDGTAAIARRCGAEVLWARELHPGPVLGKGDAMWRALPHLHGEIVCFLDADSGAFGPHYVTGLLGPLLACPSVSFVKGFYRRPFRAGGVSLPDEGGRVTELTARPLLNLFYPSLACVQQPLAGEIAVRRALLERLPFVTGYGVDIALLIDAFAAVGLEGIAQVDLGVRENGHQPLLQLGPMAHSVLLAIASRLRCEGRLSGPLPPAFLPRGSMDAHDGSLVVRPPRTDDQPGSTALPARASRVIVGIR